MPSLTLLALGTLLVLLALPLWAKRIPPNRAYGFRTPLTVSNAQVWYATNEVAGRDLALAGLCMMGLGGLAVLLQRLGVDLPNDLLPIFVVAVLGPLMAAVAHTFFWASRFVASVPHGEKDPVCPREDESARVDTSSRRARAAHVEEQS